MPDYSAVTPKANLAILLPDLSGGGAERVAITLANEFASRGIRTSLVLLRAKGPLKTLVCPSVDIVELDSASTRKSIFPLRRWIQAVRPHALLVTPSHLGWAACLATIGLMSQERIFVREASTLSTNLAIMRPLPRILRMLAERILARSASRIALCEHCAGDLARTLGIHRQDIHVISNPVIFSNSSIDVSTKANTSSKEGPLLVAAGRLEHEKGFDVLIRAFAILRRQRNVRLLIAGSGMELDALRRLAKAEGCAEGVNFAGYVADLREPLQRASAFVLSSRWEGLPSVLIESLAMGTPVVATDGPGGSREILESGRWGELVPVDDPAALAAAMARTLESPPPLPDGAWMRRYSVDVAVTRYLSVMGFSGD